MNNKLEYNIIKKFVPKIKEEWEMVIKKITPGMFDTDRVSLDPYLGLEISCKRYQNWCRDLFDNPNSFMVVGELDGEEYCFGVYISQKNNSRIKVVLCGIFEKYKKMGLGNTLLDKNSPYKKTTSTSSNNLAAFKIYQHDGLIVSEEKYVLRKIY